MHGNEMIDLFSRQRYNTVADRTWTLQTDKRKSALEPTYLL
jgi:hypothetical protein